MSRFDVVLAAATIAVCAGEASALSQRTFVSSKGSDANPCSVASPCRSIETAIANTLPGGEVVALDSAGYGPFTITSSMTVVAPSGVVAAISAMSGIAVTITAGANDTVVLRGLAIIGQGASTGVKILQAGAVQIEQCDIGTFSAAAIDFEPSIRISLAVSDSVLHDNQHGLFAQAQTSAGAASRAEVWRTRAQDNSGDGFLLYDIARAVLVDSHAAGNANGVHFVATGLSASDTSAAIERTSIVHNHAFGVLALGSPTGSLADVNIANSTLAHNETGLGVDNASQIRLTSSQLTDNNTGIIQFGSGESFTLSTNMRYQVNNGASPTPLLPN